MGASKYSYTMTQNHRLFVLFFNSHWPTDSHQWNVRKSPDRLSPVSSYISFFPKHSQHFWLKQVHLIVTFPEDFKDKRQQVNIFFSSLSLGYFFGRHLWKKKQKKKLVHVDTLFCKSIQKARWQVSLASMLEYGFVWIVWSSNIVTTGSQQTNK